MKPSQLEEWYASRCDGLWKHRYGISIETLDNPGWRVKIDLHGTSKELHGLKPAKIQRERQDDWIHYWAEAESFNIACGPLNLSEAIDIFVEWFTAI